MPVCIRSIYAKSSYVDYRMFICLHAGDLYEEDQILNWLMTQKDPGGDVIEDLEGQRLMDLIAESGSMAVYFCKFMIFQWIQWKHTFETKNHWRPNEILSVHFQPNWKFRAMYRLKQNTITNTKNKTNNDRHGPH